MKVLVVLVAAVLLILVILHGCDLMCWLPPRTRAERVLRYMARHPQGGIEAKIAFKKLAPMGAEAIDPVVRFYKRHSRWPWGRKRRTARLAVEYLARVTDRKALPKLMRLAKERDGLLSLCATYGIRGMADKTDVGDIIQLISDDRFRWKERLLQTLGRLGGEQAPKALLEYLKAPRLRVRRGAYLGLEALGDASLVPEIRQAFESEKNPELRIAGAETLASLGDETGSAYLSGVLEADGPQYLLVAAAYASGRVRERKAVPGLTKLLGHKDSYVRDVAREALTMIGTDQALNAIDRNLPKEEREMPLSTEYEYFYSYDRDPFMDWDWYYDDEVTVPAPAEKEERER